MKNDTKSIYSLKELPINNRPRERLIKDGVNALSDYELLAIILRTGSKELSVLDLAKEIIIKEGNLGRFNNITIEELTKYNGISNAKAAEIIASIEFGKRILSFNLDKTKIHNSLDIYNYVRFDMAQLEVEILRIILLNIKSEVIYKTDLSIGSINSSKGDYQYILKMALKYSSNHVILCHNHPTGDPSPSRNDEDFTNTFIEKAKQVGIFLVDHVIIGKKKYFSFLDGRINKL